MHSAKKCVLSQGHPMKNILRNGLKDQKQCVNTNLCLVINNKPFTCSNICSALANQTATRWPDFFHKMALFEDVTLMT